MARPEKSINWDLVELKMQAGCSAKEIYGELHISDDTFYARFKNEYGKSFSDYADELHSVGKGNIRYNQYIKALEGNVPMLMWLGKTWLGQKEAEVNQSDHELTIKIVDARSDTAKQIPVPPVSG